MPSKKAEEVQIGHVAQMPDGSTFRVQSIAKETYKLIEHTEASPGGTVSKDRRIWVIRGLAPRDGAAPEMKTIFLTNELIEEPEVEVVETNETR